MDVGDARCHTATPPRPWRPPRTARCSRLPPCRTSWVARGGGATWGWSDTGVVPGFGFNFSAPTGITFVSAEEGWACGSDAAGDAGVLLHTTNGGVTWSAALTTPNRTVLRVRFAGPNDGWVLAGQVGDDENFVLYVTADGGRTWSAPRAVPNNGSTSFAAFAAQGGRRAVVLELAWSEGASSGYVVGTWVWRTTNGGATWQGAGQDEGRAGDRCGVLLPAHVAGPRPLGGCGAPRTAARAGTRCAGRRPTLTSPRPAQMCGLSPQGALHSPDEGAHLAPVARPLRRPRGVRRSPRRVGGEQRRVPAHHERRRHVAAPHERPQAAGGRPRGGGRHRMGGARPRLHVHRRRASLDRRHRAAGSASHRRRERHPGLGGRRPRPHGPHRGRRPSLDTAAHRR